MGTFVKLNNENFVIQGVSLINEMFTINGIEDEQVGVNFLNKIYQTNDVWKKTSYNTIGGIYYNNGLPDIDQSKAFRKNHAGIGYYYDEQRDAFIPPKPFESWTLDEFSCLWNPSIPYPNDGKLYQWNEDILNWEEINF
jgi:hypothetical protein